MNKDEREMLWAGRFTAAPDPEMMRLTSSIAVDVRLLECDVAATQAHARALVAAGLLGEEELWAVDDVCSAMISQFGLGTLTPKDDEDVHSFVEGFLTEQLGEVGARIHAGRSRNDLVATDFRLWCKQRAARLSDLTRELVLAICDVAEAHLETLMPGYTHLQRAQPVSLGFHLAAHASALLRDVTRFDAALGSADVSSLGAGALAGNTLGLDPSIPAQELGFSDVFVNAMDAVSDRDFAVDLVYSCALFGVHLSRLSEEIVLWSSSEFGFARLSDEWSTGSSMMPQKRNPDMAELVRGRAALAIGDLTSLLALLKGLPLAYDRDLQEDKALVFGAADRAVDAAIAMHHVIGALRFDEERMAQAAGEASTWATDVAEWLVKKGVPFREAHRAAGELVAALEERNLILSAAPEDLLADVHPLLTPDVRDLADPYASMRSRSSHGGTSPDRVREQIVTLREAANPS